MTREERDYQEALRRIKEAEKNKIVGLDLDGLYLSSFPPELASLTSLQSLNLALCDQLSDLSPLAVLTSLQSLNLAGCDQLSDLSPLAVLTSLQSLNLAWCKQLSGDLSPLASLTSLQRLDLAGCGGLTGNHGTAASKKLGVITLSRSGQ